VWVSDTGTPVSSADGDDRELGEDHGASDGGCDFLGAFYTETDVAVDPVVELARMKRRNGFPSPNSAV